MNTTEYLLTCLSEEGSEIAQACSKCNRFGMLSTNPLEVNGPDNLQRLIRELNDVLAVTELLVDHQILPANWRCLENQRHKKEKVQRHMKDSFNCGCLDELRV